MDRAEPWRAHMVGRPHACLKYWRPTQRTEFVLKRHPQVPRSQRDTVPVGVHGDGKAFNKHESISHSILELSRRERVHGCEARRFHNDTGHRVRRQTLGTASRRSCVGASTSCSLERLLARTNTAVVWQMEASRQQEAGADPFTSYVVIRHDILSC